MKRLIVNADDFGLTEKVNQAIIQGHLEGIITSASLLATGAAFESAVTLARQHPKLGVGVHLNLTEGMPVSEPARIPSLVTE
ncbi:MAG: hopanoid biosynthesis associated protein HpnK, partial [Acidobacteria bacterium]